MISLNEFVNRNNDEVYENIKELAYMCTLASNDMHFMHLMCRGIKFQECHEKADEYLSDFRELCDLCFEIYSENEYQDIKNETYAMEMTTWESVPEKEYDYYSFYETAEVLLSVLVNKMLLIEGIQGVSSDIVSEFDTWIRKFTKEANYFIPSKLKRMGDM